MLKSAKKNETSLVNINNNQLTMHCCVIYQIDDYSNLSINFDILFFLKEKKLINKGLKREIKEKRKETKEKLKTRN